MILSFVLSLLETSNSHADFLYMQTHPFLKLLIHMLIFFTCKLIFLKTGLIHILVLHGQFAFFFLFPAGNFSSLAIIMYCKHV